MSELSFNQNTLIIYTTPWCGDCRRVKQLLDDHKIGYIKINIDQDPQGSPIRRNKRAHTCVSWWYNLNRTQ